MSTYEQRQAYYAREQEKARREWYPELLEAFDRRRDGLAAKQRFDNLLGIYATLFENGSRCLLLAELMKAERQLHATAR